MANSSEQISKYVVDKVIPGSVVLLHVMFRSRAASMDALKGLIDGLRRKGYSFVAVSDLLMRKGG